MSCETWQRVDEPVTAKSTIMSMNIHATDPKKLIYLTRGGQVMWTEDRCASWNEKQLPAEAGDGFCARHSLSDRIRTFTMASRLNGIIRALETAPGVCFTSFIQAEVENAVAFAQSDNDGVVFELEHNPWDIRALREAMQFLLLRQKIVQTGSIACPMTPIVRIPPSGSEMNQWFAKQALDLGAYGIVWPRISTPEEAYNAVAACRYPRLRTDKPLLRTGGTAWRCADGGRALLGTLPAGVLQEGRCLAARARRRNARRR